MNRRSFFARFAAVITVLVMALSFVSAVFADSTPAGGVTLSGRQQQMELIARSKKKRKQTSAPVTVATPAPETQSPTATPLPEGPIIDPQSIADYLFANGHLPDNFITKKEAQRLGWDSSWNYVSDVAPGMSLGGTYFGNYEGVLPKVQGRTYYECDCYYKGGKRNAYRLVFSDDGHVYYSDDHYATFTELFPTVPSARKYNRFTVK